MKTVSRLNYYEPGVPNTPHTGTKNTVTRILRAKTSGIFPTVIAMNNIQDICILFTFYIAT